MDEPKITSVNANRFSNHPEWDRFYTLIEDENGKRHCDINFEDFTGLMGIYKNIPHEGLKKDSVGFVLDISWRIYSEWCMSPDEGQKDTALNHNKYHGEGFTKFVNDEVHYELKRERSANDRGSHEGYLKARQRVLGGIALRALELFSAWEGKTWPPHRTVETDKRTEYIYDDKRNLRCKEGLDSYITQFSELLEKRKAA